MAAEDTQLLELLSAALAPPHVDPPREGVLALRRALSGWRPTARPPARRWWRRRWAVVAGSGIFVLGGSGVAFAAGAPMPTAVREIASDMGLPVASPAMHSLQQDETTLEGLLGRPAPDPASTTRAEEALRHQLDELDPVDRAAAGSEPESLIWQARRSIGSQRTVAGGPPVCDNTNSAPGTRYSSTAPGTAGGSNARTCSTPPGPVRHNQVITQAPGPGTPGGYSGTLPPAGSQGASNSSPPSGYTAGAPGGQGSGPGGQGSGGASESGTGTATGDQQVRHDPEGPSGTNGQQEGSAAAGDANREITRGTPHP